MTSTELLLDSADIHPIDIVENLAASRSWDFDRVTDNQIAMAVEGTWRTYSITLAWSDYDETLRMIATFDMEPPSEKLGQVYEVLNLVNDQCWTGSFTLWPKQKLMVYRYGLLLAGGGVASAEQIDQLLHDAVIACERYYPAFQLVSWGDEPPEKAIDVAIAEAYGRA